MEDGFARLPRNPSDESDRASVGQQDWDVLVRRHAGAVWDLVRRHCETPEQTSAICQLMWLRLEMQTREGPVPADVTAWLSRQVATECERATNEARRRAERASDDGREAP